MFKTLIQKALASRVAVAKAPSNTFSALRVGQISTFPTAQRFSIQQRFFSEDQEEFARKRRYPPINSPNILVRGLPWDRHTVEDVKKLFPELELADVTIYQEGDKPTGFILVKFSSVDDARKAMRTAKNLMVDDRTVYTKPVSEEEIAALENDHKQPATVLAVKRLPFSSSEEEVKQIFADNKVAGVVLSEGAAFVRFATPQDAQAALEKNGVEFARRKLIVHRSSGYDYRRAEANPSRVVKVRGAHSGATEDDIKAFFKDFNVVAVTFTTRDSSTGRKIPGDIFVEFGTPQEAAEALKLDRQSLGDRFLQIYRSSRKERKGRLFGFGNNRTEGGEQQQRE